MALLSPRAGVTCNLYRLSHGVQLSFVRLSLAQRSQSQSDSDSLSDIRVLKSERHCPMVLACRAVSDHAAIRF